MINDRVKNYQLSILKSVEEIELIIDEWQSLIESETQASKVFLSPAWIMPWLLVHERDKPYFICIYNNSQLIALAPLVMEKSWGGAIRCLRVAGSRFSQYQDLMLCRLGYRATTMNLVVDHLIHQNLADLVYLPDVTENSLFQNISDVQTLHSNAQYCSILDLQKDQQSEQNTRSIKKRVKKEVNHKIRKLSKSGALSFSVHDGKNDTPEELITIMFKWKQAWLREKALYGGFFSQKDNFRFLNKLKAGNFDKNSDVIITILNFNNVPIAIAIGLIKSDTFHCYITAHNPELSDYSPGTILFSNILDWMKDIGLACYDFLGYPEAYKTRFSNEKVNLFDVWLPLTFRGKLAMWVMQSNIIQWIKTRFYQLPLSWRKLILGIRNFGNTKFWH